MSKDDTIIIQLSTTYTEITTRTTTTQIVGKEMPDREPAGFERRQETQSRGKKCRTENLRILNDDKKHRAEEKKCRTENLRILNDNKKDTEQRKEMPHREMRILNDDKKHRAEEKICRTEKPADFERRQETKSRGKRYRGTEYLRILIRSDLEKQRRRSCCCRRSCRCIPSSVNEIGNIRLPCAEDMIVGKRRSLVGTEAKESKEHNPHKAATTEAGKGHGSKIAHQNTAAKTMTTKKKKKSSNNSNSNSVAFQFKQPRSILSSAV
jgi:hypothetical protein